MRVINAIKDLDSKGILKLGLNKEKKRISLLQLLMLADIIVFSDAFSLGSIGCQFQRGKRRENYSSPFSGYFLENPNDTFSFTPSKILSDTKYVISFHTNSPITGHSVSYKLIQF